jgi:hypothetical protein
MILNITDVISVTTSTTSPLDIYYVIEGNNTKRYVTSISSIGSTNLPSPVSGVSSLTEIIIHNRDAATANNVTVVFNAIVLWQGSLGVGRSLVYKEATGFILF